MKRLILSGIVYLIGVAVILAFKPAFMFRTDGVWKEFGIGRNKQTHTWFPFWLFVIAWAIISYVIAFIIIPGEVIVEMPKRRNRQNRQLIEAPEDVQKSVTELKPGYYVLNAEGTKDGVPRYVYLGPSVLDT